MKSIPIAALAAATALGGASIAQTGGKPTFGLFGFDMGGMKANVAPGDDFFAYANGGWVDATPIPADKARFGAFDTLQDLSQQRTRGLLEEPQQQHAKIGVAYAAYLDQPAIEAKGLTPIQPWLDRIKALHDKADYPALLAEAARNGVGGPFSAGVTQDAKRPDIYTVGIRQAGLGLPDRDYYLSDSPKLVETKKAYQAHIAKMLTLAGEPSAEVRAEALTTYETAIAKAHWTNIESRDADKTYNKTSVADLDRGAPGFDFAAWLKASRLPVDAVIVGQPSAVTGEAALIAAASLQVLKDQLLVRSLDEFADVLPAAFDTEHFALVGTVLRGTPEQQVRWKRAVDWTSAALTDDVAKIYVTRYFPPATKAAADQLVRNIIAAMNVRIDKLAWMTSETKAKAHAKLANFVPRIGYPSKWRDYAALEVRPGDAFGNKLRANQWQRDFNTGKLGKAVYRWEWGLTPMQVNAQANPTLVAITFPAAILQPPFFDPKADPAVNYGGIGVVIGHEMSHHFDDQGSKFDGEGRLTQWWTAADIAAFQQRTGQLVAQYDKYEPLPGFHVKGGLTLGENTADLAGLAASYDAYHKSLGGKPAPLIAGTTGDQRFYLGYAQVWRAKSREPALRQQLLSDPHSPPAERVDEVRNVDAWYAAFNVPPGRKLYLAPEQRVRIW